MVKKYSDLVGHEDVIGYMKSAVKQSKVAHAYILSGEKGIGKTSITNVFVRTLFCENIHASEEIEPCGECNTCIKIANQNHPDIITLEREKKEITIKEVRSQVINDVDIKPYEGKRKIYIIPDADKMNLQSQNAILKTIEEPPAYVVIILQVSNADALIGTIQSRCVNLNLKSVRDEKIIQYLMHNEQLPDYEAKICTAFAQGNIGKAVKLSRSEEFKSLKSKVVDMLTQLKKARQDRFNQYVKEAVELKEHQQDYFDVLTIWMRDVLIYKSTGNVKKLIFQENQVHIKRYAQEFTYESIEITLAEIEKTKQRLKANVAYDVAMEILLRTIKES